MYKIPHFSMIAKEGSFNGRSHGGVAFYIHESIPFQEIHLTTQIQAIAITVPLKTKITICNIYNSRSHELSNEALLQLYQQLPHPCLLIGDFNAYSRSWGCTTTDTRGRIMERFINETDLVLMNSGAPTHPNSSTDTSIDLSLSSPAISQDFEWNTLPSVLDSDHFPIILSTHTREPEPEPNRLIKKANWYQYAQSSAWRCTPHTRNHMRSPITEYVSHDEPSM